MNLSSGVFFTWQYIAEKCIAKDFSDRMYNYQPQRNRIIKGSSLPLTLANDLGVITLYPGHKEFNTRILISHCESWWTR